MAPVTLLSARMRTDALGRWAAWMTARSWSETTIRERVGLLRRIAETAGVEPDALNENHVLEFLSRPGLAPGTRATYHASLNAWFRWLRDSGLREDDPLAHLARPRGRRQSLRTITTAHLEQLLASRLHRRTRTMIILGAYAGLRASEIAGFHGRMVDRLSGEIEVVGKGGVRANLPLHPAIAVEAARYPDGWWFPQHVSNRAGEGGGHVLGSSVTTILGAAMRRAGVPGSAHSLRHWYATEMLRQGVDSRVIQELMRHASLATTERYLHVDDGQRRAGVMRLPDLRAA